MTTSSNQFDLGMRLRSLREARGLSLRSLSKVSFVAVSTISKIENNKLSASYDTLVMLSKALNVKLADIFAEDDSVDRSGRRSLTRAGSGKIYETDNYLYEMLCSELRGKKALPIVAQIKKSSVEAFGDFAHHPGEEFVYVLSGSVEIHTELYDPVTLQPGDSIYFDSRMGHALISTGETQACVLWLQMPNDPQSAVETIPHPAWTEVQSAKRTG